MPRTYPPRRVRCDARLDQSDLDALDALVTATDTDRSTVLRALLATAISRPDVVTDARDRLLQGAS